MYTSTRGNLVIWVRENQRFNVSLEIVPFQRIVIYQIHILQFEGSLVLYGSSTPIP